MDGAEAPAAAAAATDAAKDPQAAAPAPAEAEDDAEDDGFLGSLFFKSYYYTINMQTESPHPKKEFDCDLKMHLLK